MRKSTVLTLAIVAALIAVLLVLWTFVSKTERRPADEPSAPVTSEEPALTTERRAELESTTSRERADVNAPRAADSPASGPEGTALRIRVRCAPEIAGEPKGLEVGISNRMGDLFPPTHPAANEFLLGSAPPDVYLVVAKAIGYRTAVERVTLSSRTAETAATITLAPQRSVHVRWRSDDGRPIKVGIADAKHVAQSARLEVCATKFRPDARPDERWTLAALRTDILLNDQEDGKRTADEVRIDWIVPEPVDPRATTDSFGTMRLDEDGVVWVSAICNDALVATMPVQPGQDVVEFMTALDDLGAHLGSAQLVVVDGETGLPVEGAALFVDGDKDGGGARSNAQGALVRAGIPAGRHRANVWSEGYRETNVGFTAHSGETVDLGTVRLVTAHPCASFRVTGAEDVMIAGASFELVALEDDPDPARPRPMYIATASHPAPGKGSGPVANLRFEDVQRGRYLLRCMSRGLDAAPRVVEASELRPESDATPIAEIAVRAAGAAGFVLDPPIARGTRIVIESTAGLPLRELDVDEFGVAATELFSGDYRLHLVEYGRATGAVDVRVDRHPFVFEIHR